MSELPADEVYKFIEEFPAYQELAEFAKRFLEIKDSEINDMKHDYSHSIREQKYQIIQKWKRKVGRRATIELLHQTLANFRGQNNEVDDGRSQPFPIPSQATESPRPPRSQTSDMASGRNTEPGNGAVGSTPPLQQRDPITETNQSNESGEARDRASTGEVNEAQVPGKAFRGDEETGIGNLRLDDYCAKAENLSVKMCTLEEIKIIEQQFDADDAYHIARTGNKGYVLVVNNNFTGQKDERVGSKTDVKSIKELWTQLGYQVRIEQDLTADQIYKILEKLAKGIKDYNLLAVFLMSHGTLKIGEDILKGSDGEDVYVRDVLSKFDNTSCPSLRGKPKLFFFQFCRGGTIDSGVSCGDTEKKLSESMLVYHTVQPDLPGVLPCRSDIHVSYATQPGYAAYRDHDGSWFINAITNIFAKFAQKEHVDELMTRVRRAVSEKLGYTEILTPDKKTVLVACKEMSESRSLLTKKLYLMPTNISSDPLADE